MRKNKNKLLIDTGKLAKLYDKEIVDLDGEYKLEDSDWL